MGPTTSSILWRGGPAAAFGTQAVIESDIVVSGRVGSVDADGTWIVAQNLHTGAELWRVKLPINFANSWRSRVSAIHGGQVYATRTGNSNSEYLYALSAVDGSILWRSQDLLDEEAETESLAFADNGDPIVGNLTSLVRISRADGSTVWRASRDSAGSPMATVFGDRVYAWDHEFNVGFVVRALDVASGARLYASVALPFGVFPAPTGLMAGPGAAVYAGIDTRNIDGAFAFTALRDTGSALVEEWRVPSASIQSASFGVGPDGSVYTYSPTNQILRLDPFTGATRNTSIPIPSFSSLFMPRMAIDSAGRVFLTADASSGGTLYFFDADLTLRWTDGVLGVSSGGPALGDDGTLVVCGVEIQAYKGGGSDWSTAVGGNPDRASLSTAMGPASPSVLWRAGIPALYGQPVVVDGQVVVSTRSEASGADGAWILAQDLGAGAELWRQKLPVNFGDSWFSRVSGIGDGQVYVTRSGNINSEYVYALSETDGSILWRSGDLTDEYLAESLGFAPNGDLIVGNFRTITRIDRSNGATIWSTPRQCPTSGGCAAAVFKDRVYVWDVAQTGQALDLVISAFNITTGERLYSSAPLSQGAFTIEQIGVIAGPNGAVYAPLASGTPADSFVALQDTGSALEERWRAPMGYVPFASFGVGPDATVYTYSAADEVLRLDPATGSVLSISMPIPFDGTVFQPRMAIDSAGRVFLTNGAGPNGAIYSFNPDLTLRWSDSVPGIGGPALSLTGTLVASGSLEVRTYKTSPGQAIAAGAERSASSGDVGVGKAVSISLEAKAALGRNRERGSPRPQTASGGSQAPLVTIRDGTLRALPSSDGH